MTPEPYPSATVTQVNRIAADRPLRGALWAGLYLLSLHFYPVAWTLACLAGYLVCDFWAIRYERRLREARSRADYHKLCALYAAAMSSYVLLAVSVMSQGTAPQIVFGTCLLWTLLAHCATVRTDKPLVHGASMFPVIVGLIQIIPPLAALTQSPIDVAIYYANGTILALYVSITVKESIVQKTESLAARRKSWHAERAKDRFLAAISHEIRTPLNGILGIAQIMDDEAHDDAARERARVLLASGTVLRSIVDDILDHTKLRDGEFSIRPAATRVAGTVDQVADLFGPMAAERGTRVMRELRDLAPGAVLIDPLRTQQIVSNLVSNAVKFTRNGTVSIVARSVRRDSAPWLEIAVNDDGIGIPADDLETVFHPFHQVEVAPHIARQGTGLGLSIARELARRMGGDLTAVSMPGRGASFILTIPAPSILAAETPVRPWAESLGGWHLLIIDDNAVNRMIAKTLACRAGATVTTADSGSEAMLLLLAGTRFDAVLTDIMMPGIDGFELLRQVRGTGTVPVIALTAQDPSEVRARAAFDGILAKPLDRDQMVAVVTRAIQAKEDETPALRSTG